MPKKIPALHRGVALSRSERKQIGPIQIVVLGFEDLTFEGDILPELKRLSELDVIRLVDMVIVAKSGSGELVRVQAGSLSENEVARLGSIAELLVGLTTDDEQTMPTPARSRPICAYSPVIRAHGRSSMRSLRTLCASLR